jgi:hypothetical protein
MKSKPILELRGSSNLPLQHVLTQAASIHHYTVRIYQTNVAVSER